jgi:hypothetical protein
MVISQLKDLGEDFFSKAILTKLACSLPPKYDSILKAWENVTKFENTPKNLQLMTRPQVSC